MLIIIPQHHIIIILTTVQPILTHVECNEVCLKSGAARRRGAPVRSAGWERRRGAAVRSVF